MAMSYKHKQAIFLPSCCFKTLRNALPEVFNWTANLAKLKLWYLQKAQLSSPSAGCLMVNNRIALCNGEWKSQYIGCIVK